MERLPFYVVVHRSKCKKEAIGRVITDEWRWRAFVSVLSFYVEEYTPW